MALCISSTSNTPAVIGFSVTRKQFFVFKIHLGETSLALFTLKLDAA